MSLTIHLANMPQRAAAKMPAAQERETSDGADPSRAFVALRRVSKAAIMITGMVLILSAIIAIRVWAWLPQTRY
jgi:hypothetical protein